MTSFIDELDSDAFLGLANYLIGETDAINDFEERTGFKYRPGKSPIERMIDQASGYDREFCLKWLRYVEEWHWGEAMPRLVADVVAKLESGESL